ncbi:hypothetical protein BJF91_16935 [Allorhizobium taibaishanense]|uniref:Uncharacterized protein n=1 Tax=Allorhizobium taibaishanense TaxID=887144 RepID=A0A1Q9A2R4_9HYPH|nr:hypothetical protein [Allorhizobium taibaishanense]OLP48822.1 hypothetical protein BJF91_16935 [Allorhizobium taibaishanense]
MATPEDTRKGQHFLQSPECRTLTVLHLVKMRDATNYDHLCLPESEPKPAPLMNRPQGTGSTAALYMECQRLQEERRLNSIPARVRRNANPRLFQVYPCQVSVGAPPNTPERYHQLEAISKSVNDRSERMPLMLLSGLLSLFLNGPYGS